MFKYATEGFPKRGRVDIPTQGQNSFALHVHEIVVAEWADPCCTMPSTAQQPDEHDRYFGSVHKPLKSNEFEAMTGIIETLNLSLPH